MNKVKMYETDIYKLKAHYHDFYRVKHNTYGYGTAFIFATMTNEELQVIKSFRNTKISFGQYRYAKEITNVRVILYDKCIREAGETHDN